MHPRLTIVLALVLHFSSTAAAFADLTNSNTPVCTAPDHQIEPLIVTDGAGGAIMVWYDRRSGQDYDVFAQRVSSTGSPLWTTNGVAICTAMRDQVDLSMTEDASGGALIAWADPRANHYDVYAQRISASGVPQWGTNGTKVSSGNGNQILPFIVSDGVGGAIVVWTDDPQAADAQIVAQRVNASGSRQWGNKGVALCNAVGDQFLKDLRPDGSGGAVAVWIDQRAPGFNGDVFVQRVSASGQVQWTPDGVGLSSTGNADLPRIVEDGTGGALFAWTELGSLFEDDIVARRVSPSGVAQSPFPVCTAPLGQHLARAIRDGSGGSILVWDDNRNGTVQSNETNDIFAQHLSAGDMPLWGVNGTPVTQAPGGQYLPSVALDGAGGAWFAWESLPFQGQGLHGVHAQRLDATGSPVGPPDSITTLPIARMVRITANGSGGIVAAWQDLRSQTHFDIYAQVLPVPTFAMRPEPSIDRLSPIASPTSFGIRALIPNPARGETGVDFVLPQAARMRLVVRDVQGRLLRVLHEGPSPGGSHHVAFDLRDRRGHVLPRGVYLVELCSEGLRSVARLTVR